jgi:hypothetical protein
MRRKERKKDLIRASADSDAQVSDDKADDDTDVDG